MAPIDKAENHENEVAYWNSEGGERWLARHERLEAMLTPLTEALMVAAAIQPGDVVIDVGCGTGATVFDLSDAVGPTGKVIAVDVSAPLIARTIARTAELTNVDCVLGDASCYPFGDAVADLIVSRLGVMFFGDPPAAFAHLRSALRPGGRIAFACWRTLAENPWMSIPVTAAAPYLPPAEKPQPGAPGPFAFADADDIRAILTESGYSAISIDTFDPMFSLMDESGLEGAVDHATKFGPVARRLTGQPDSTVALVRSAVRDALHAHETADGLFLPGAVWIVQAQR